MAAPFRQFTSDNFSGACPEALEAMRQANAGHTSGYGSDPWTGEARRLLQQLFDADCDVFFVFNGTSANSLALASTCAPYESVLCHENAHLARDSCGALGFFGHGTTLVRLPGELGKLNPASIVSAVTYRSDVHHSPPRALTLTQSTELGTIYSIEEVRALTSAAHALELASHMDGARFANAAATLGATPAALTWQAGVDVLTFGGTKNGMVFGEVVLFFDHDLARRFEYRCKQGGQLAPKMRFLAAQWVGMLQDGAWLRYGARANAMAAQLEKGLRNLRGVSISYPCEANAVFASLPAPLAEGLRERGWQFYTDMAPDGAARLMCSWDTTAEDVAAFLRDCADLAK